MNVLKESNNSPVSNSTTQNLISGIKRSVSSHSSPLGAVISENLDHSENRGNSMPHSTRPDSLFNSSNSKLPIYVSNATIFNGMSRNAQKHVSDFGPMLSYSGTNNNDAHLTSPSMDSYSASSVTSWNSAIGRAGLGGKSGRVIERLMGDNDMLKRDLKIERLRAEEHKQAVKLAEGRMEALSAEYEGKLHDAAINKTLLKRKERQLADLRQQIEIEKNKAIAAVESERKWKEEIEKVESKAKRDIEDALNYAAMMEARNNTMTNHWKDQGLEVNRAVAKLSKEIEDIVLERKQDDERLNTLQGLCDQQATQFSEIVRERDEISKVYEEYKSTQEEALRDIKRLSRKQREESERVIAETTKTLNELKWALGLKMNERKK
ncbi:hypothetical protein HI914_05153 [Erysiphe necator]|uniref:Uncharacterized protein n=1 Tax=Uncinula necator TaxID=52586 RepID=A0A0B1PEJ9_UNCNE|nr:hypothetical protein HI914_05153 [Erysiphe necator]KHJ35069.1 hypothetical protein EV44_g5637 [Erysiphe necator]